jgi:hypothetical protein
MRSTDPIRDFGAALIASGVGERAALMILLHARERFLDAALAGQSQSLRRLQAENVSSMAVACGSRTVAGLDGDTISRARKIPVRPYLL